MNAPVWLPNILAAVLLLVAVYSLARAVLAWRGVQSGAAAAGDIETDGFHALAAIAVAGLSVSWMGTLPRGAWEAVFVLAFAWFAWRMLTAVRDGKPRSAAGRPAVYATASVILLYMFLAGVAPSTLDGSTAGLYTMAGMEGMIKDTTIQFPTIGLIMAVVMAGYAVTALNRITPAASAPAKAPEGAGTDTREPVAARSAEAAAAAPKATAAASGTPAMGARLTALFAPRSVECVRAVLCIAMAYAILAKLV